MFQLTRIEFFRYKIALLVDCTGVLNIAAILK